jgi:hypothetical protein
MKHNYFWRAKVVALVGTLEGFIFIVVDGLDLIAAIDKMARS